MKSNRKTMKTSAPATAEAQNLFEIRKLVLEGEGQQLEFKRKAAHPEKVVRELIAFANSDGGTLLIGVDDDGTIPGVKYPDEEIHVVSQSLLAHCKPLLVYQESVLPISENRFVVRYDVSPGNKIHFLVLNNTRETFVRVQDMSIKASAEMQEIIRRSKKKRDVRFTFGESEKNLLQQLEQIPHITLAQYMKFSGLNRFKASRKLILLVLANVLKITASEKGDLYSRA
ncbi:MAG: putative transcriptional regulator with HTH domain protein [Bacteroidetes bacterium OLB12]|nr:MAG: putative transcriptional regulator with HTH domain protein [Bacteroidetes bacterium OLB12]